MYQIKFGEVKKDKTYIIENSGGTVLKVLATDCYRSVDDFHRFTLQVLEIIKTGNGEGGTYYPNMTFGFDIRDFRDDIKFYALEEEIDLLDLEFFSKDLDEHITIKSFFHRLMVDLWLKQHEFNAKRPFGSADWDGDLIVCLINNKIIKGEVDEDGYIVEYDEKELNKIILEKVIGEIFE